MKRRRNQLIFTIIIFLSIILFFRNISLTTPSVSRKNLYDPTNENSSITKDFTCTNTKQGKKLIADNNGGLCLRSDVNVLTNCCSKNLFHEKMCKENQFCMETFECCEEYEMCVSCCHLQNSFEQCIQLCRTSSKSLHHQNKFRSEFKYCYGNRLAPLK